MRRRRIGARWSRIAAALVVGVLAVGWLPGTAPDAQARPLATVKAASSVPLVNFTAVSCPAAQLCVAGGDINGALVTATTTDFGGSWSFHSLPTSWATPTTWRASDAGAAGTAWR